MDDRQHLVSGWDGEANFSLSSGYVYLGLPANTGGKLADLLRQAYAISRASARWSYGIGYARSSSKAPDLYATGLVGGDDPFDDSEEARIRIYRWFDEMSEQRRYLAGYFRDVYPANLLSSRHLNANLGEGKTLLTAGWGTFEQLDPGVWLWTLADEEIAPARAAIEQAGLSVTDRWPDDEDEE